MNKRQLSVLNFMLFLLLDLLFTLSSKEFQLTVKAFELTKYFSSIARKTRTDIQIFPNVFFRVEATHKKVSGNCPLFADHDDDEFVGSSLVLFCVR